MAAALMLMVAAGLVLSSWVTVMAARAAQVSNLETTIHRRQSLLNTHAISRQALLQHRYAADASHSGLWEASLSAPNNVLWGGAATSAGWTGNVFGSNKDAASSNTLYPFNASGLARGDAFFTTEELTSSTAVWNSQDYVRSFGFVKMNCPPLRGDLFTVFKKSPGHNTDKELDIHRSVPGSTGHFGSWVVEGRMVIKDIPSLFTPSTQSPLQIPARVRSLYIPEENANHTIVATSSTGARMPPSNLAGIPMTVGTVNDADMWSDRLDVVRNPDNPENSLWHFMEREQAAGHASYVTVDSANFNMGVTDPPLWIERQIYPDPGRVPKPGETVGITYPSANSELVTTGNGTWNVLFIKMDHPNLPHIRITADYSFNTGIHQLVLRGQAPLSAAYTNASLLPPVIILTDNATSNALAGVRDIRFEHMNNRRWILGVKTISSMIEDNLELNWEGNPVLEAGKNVHVWRCILINECREVYLNLRFNQNVRFVGGVMTNWIFKRRRSASGYPRNEAVDGLVFSLDDDPEPAGALGPKFSSLLPRDAWLETYFNLPDQLGLVPAPP